jgi:hypothetical protein
MKPVGVNMRGRTGLQQAPDCHIFLVNATSLPWSLGAAGSDAMVISVTKALLANQNAGG